MGPKSSKSVQKIPNARPRRHARGPAARVLNCQDRARVQKLPENERMDWLGSAEILLFEGFRFDRPGGGLFRLDRAGIARPVALGSRALGPAIPPPSSPDKQTPRGPQRPPPKPKPHLNSYALLFF